jgi:16S rRNA processing protein RimM
MTRYYKVGKIVNTHGIRGEIKVITTSDFAESRYKTGNVLYYFPTSNLQAGGPGIPLQINSHRVHKQFDLLTFVDHPSINDVEKYKGGYLAVSEDQREALEPGEYYYNEIIGCDVYTDEGKRLGVIREILSPGANDVWVVKQDQGPDILLPYIDDVIKQVDVEDKKITVHLLEGLVDE